MISIDPNQLSAQDNYKLLIGSVVPRPIALVTTLSDAGVLNAAPFSFFNVVASNPPMISVAVQRKQGVQKDTARNANAKGEFVVHIADENYIEALNQTAALVPPDVSEVELANLTAVPSERISVPGLLEAGIRMECLLEQSIPLGGTADEPACDLLIGRVVYFHFSENVYDNGYVIANSLKPVARMAGNDYVKLGEMFSIVRPK
ncbi:flavin reductase family protein [Paenibacillus sp. IITD108]|uniref:flavin reductase family protein n=1 Tax=Paenibacillus sp. IITD108 TaxID=3116649 RepID=UPI002F3FC608